jgi:hypothetical protein
MKILKETDEPKVSRRVPKLLKRSHEMSRSIFCWFNGLFKTSWINIHCKNVYYRFVIVVLKIADFPTKLHYDCTRMAKIAFYIFLKQNSGLLSYLSTYQTIMYESVLFVHKITKSKHHMQLKYISSMSFSCVRCLFKTNDSEAFCQQFAYYLRKFWTVTQLSESKYLIITD